MALHTALEVISLKSHKTLDIKDTCTHKKRETLAVAESKSPPADSLTNSFTNLGKYFLGR